MEIVLLTMVPWAVAKALRGGGEVLSAPRDAKAMVAIAVAGLFGAGLSPTLAPMVRIAFALGAIAVARVFWRTSRLRWLTVLATAGAAANALPIISHGAMPVMASARARVGSADAVEPRLLGAKHESVDTIDPWLAPFVDAYAVSALNAVVSVGDIVLLASFAILGLIRIPASN